MNENISHATKQELEKLYFEQKKSSYEIAAIYGVYPMLVRRIFKELGITTRNYSESAKLTRNGKSGSEHHAWKGDNVKYQALHAWVRRHKGIPDKCEHCGTAERRKYEWANVSKQYKRDLNDWVRLCTPCHRKFDN